MPPTSRIDSWRSSKSQAKLAIDWAALPDLTPVKRPDGTTEPARTPWPFLLYVTSGESNRKIEESVLSDTRIAIASQACKLIRIQPAKAVELPFLRSIPNIVDPTLLVVDRNLRVTGVLRQQSEFTADKCLSLMARAADDAYAIKLAAYVAGWVDILKEGEKQWAEELKLEDQAARAGDRSSPASSGAYKEIQEREKALKAAEAALLERESALRASLKLKPYPDAAVPATVGRGRNKRALTPQEREALEAFRTYSRDPNPLVRAAAVEDLGAIDSAAMVEEILKAANDVDPRVVQAAGAGLARMKSPESLAALCDALSGGSDKAREAALLGFASGMQMFAAATPAMIAALKDRDDDVRRAAVLGLAAQGDAAAAAPLVAVLSDEVEALRVLAASALGDLRAKDAGPSLVGLLDASDWSLRKAAVEALAKIRVKESIGPLVERFGKEEGLLLEVIQKSLVAITGRDFGYDAESWRRWWGENSDRFQVPTDAEIKEAKARAEKAMAGYAKPGKRTYHTIETLSRKMIFIIDVSSSMDDKIVIPAEAPESVKAEYPSRVKMEIARKALVDLLATLDSNVYFNIVTFAGRVNLWQESLAPASAKNAAIKFVSKLEPVRASGKGMGSDEQKTNTFGALKAAFGLADAEVANWKARTKVDTIFLVTDGEPTAGEIIEVPKLIRAITDLNKTRGVVVHVICFDRMAGERLRPLAELNGGKYVLRGF